MKADRPAGVTAIAAVFLLAAAYLFLVGVVMLASPGRVSLAAGADLLGGLELAGPYMFLLVAALVAITGIGLLRFNNWARRAAIAFALIGIFLLMPSVSSALVGLRMGKLAWRGFGVILRVMLVWYLFQTPVKEIFDPSQTEN